MIEITSERKLNLEKLAKGDFISEDVLREVTGFDPRENPETYSFAILRIRSELRKRQLFTRGQGYAIRILTTTEATYYKHDRARIHRRGQQRDYDDLASLDEREMDEITRQQHRKHIEETSRFLSAQQQTAKQIRVTQARERLSHSHQDKPIKIVSTKKGQEDGTSTNHNTAHGNEAAVITQRPNGESLAPIGEANEIADQ